MSEAVKQWVAEHPECRDDMVRAYFAFLVPHFRDHPNAHNFPGALRTSRCVWCGESREEIRYGEGSGICLERPQDANAEVSATIRLEEEKYFVTLKKAEYVVRNALSKQEMSGKLLAVLHHTYGFDPEVVGGIVDVPESMIREYNYEMDKERQRSRECRNVEVITVR